jgi:hypothetical protein
MTFFVWKRGTKKGGLSQSPPWPMSYAASRRKTFTANRGHLHSNLYGQC